MGLTTSTMVAAIDPRYYGWLAVVLAALTVGAIVAFIVIKRLFRPSSDRANISTLTGFGLEELRRMCKSGLISEQEFKELRKKTIQKTGL